MLAIKLIQASLLFTDDADNGFFSILLPTDKCSSPKNLKHSQSLKEQGTKTSIKERRAKSSVLKHSQSIKEEPDTCFYVRFKGWLMLNLRFSRL
jgi:hypothetical protein